MESIRSSYVALCKSRIRLIIFGGHCPGGLLTCGPTCQCFTKPIRIPHEAEQRQKQHVVKLKKMREKRIQQRVKWWLLRPSNLILALLLCPSNLTVGKVQLCDLTPHCSLLRRRHDWGASPLLLCTVISVWHVDMVAWCPTCRWKKLEHLWKRALHSYDGGVDDTTAQWTVTCSTV